MTWAAALFGTWRFAIVADGFETHRDCPGQRLDVRATTFLRRQRGTVIVEDIAVSRARDYHETRGVDWFALDWRAHEALIRDYTARHVSEHVVNEFGLHPRVQKLVPDLRDGFVAAYQQWSPLRPGIVYFQPHDVARAYWKTFSFPNLGQVGR